MTGDIVAFNGPFPAGKWPDINIFRNKTKRYLPPGEKVLGDLGYKGDPKVITKINAKNIHHSYAMGCARDRHETVNARIKTWGALRLPFRHDRHDHHFFFHSATVIEQIKFQNGAPLFQIINYIDPFLF